ncbi:hypothetical protein KCP76_25085 [Salmonella enterica subsp. enterica serovar Weltevreden]|nr:hypothetical protein KCP76_25085 [Salmonella enterica subsp. enterica serovar Weltevreden]
MIARATRRQRANDSAANAAAGRAPREGIVIAELRLYYYQPGKIRSRSTLSGLAGPLGGDALTPAA